MPTLETATRNAACDAIVDLVDVSGPGSLVFEASNDSDVATLVLSNPGFGDAATGVATANSITSDTSANTGTIDHVSLYDGASTKIMECTIATDASADFQISSLSVSNGDTVSCSSLTVTVPA
jgi:hypothetical protein